MKKTLSITAAAVVLIGCAAAALLCTLGAQASPHQLCGHVEPNELRAPADPGYAKQFENLARCSGKRPA